MREEEGLEWGRKMIEKSEFKYWQAKHKDFTVISNIKSGKEADVIKVSIDDHIYALKIYKKHSILSSRSEYLAGKWIRENSLRKAVQKKAKVGKELLERLWTKREFYMLKKFRSLGANVPEVYNFNNKSILMAYLGDEVSAAPRLVDIELDKPSYENILKEIIESIKIFLECGVVHGDLSEYNILWWNNKPWIIDFPQSIDIRVNSNWEDFLKRDLKNLKGYFSKYIDVENIELYMKKLDNKL